MRCPGGEKPGQSTALDGTGLAGRKKWGHMTALVAQLCWQYRGKNGKTTARGETQEGEFQARGGHAHSEGNWETVQLWGTMAVSSVTIWGRVKRSGGRSTGKGRPGPPAG